MPDNPEVFAAQLDLSRHRAGDKKRHVLLFWNKLPCTKGPDHSPKLRPRNSRNCLSFI